ncbi:MAG TPA: TlpA disulfide reductase family protein [Bacteroidia bacterium]|jgi:peroxiredoxin|nr:TlpA disulfide reductase family protein [Bacteroidia bacterium]
MKIRIFPTLFLLCVLAFQAEAQKAVLPKAGTWQGELQLNGTTRLPFYFEYKKSKTGTSLEITNGDEKIDITEIQAAADSFNFKMPLYDSEFRIQVKEGGKSMEGTWINHSRKDHREIPFQAFYGREYSCDKSLPVFNVLSSSKWEVTFTPTDEPSYKAVGVFKFNPSEHSVKGTFLTETGDYRYLSGYACTDWIYMSCFDGSHAYYFRWKIKSDSTLAGDFYSGTTGFEKWTATRNNKFSLRNPDSLTFLKKGVDKISFKYKNTDGKDVSLEDERYKNKVVIIQIMGSWCPNCMDETAYLAGEYTALNGKGLEVVALAFEKTADPLKAAENLNRVKARFHATYDFLITGKSGSTQASEALPMLNAVMAFPTTIYIDKKGRVRKIYTGFSGPGTGAYYDRFKEENERFLQKLLAE